MVYKDEMERLERIFFWWCFVITIWVIYGVVSVSFGGNEISPSWTKVHAIFLAAYIGMKRIRRHGQEDPKDLRRGQYFVYVIWG